MPFPCHAVVRHVQAVIHCSPCSPTISAAYRFDVCSFLPLHGAPLHIVLRMQCKQTSNCARPSRALEMHPVRQKAAGHAVACAKCRAARLGRQVGHMTPLLCTSPFLMSIYASNIIRQLEPLQRLLQPRCSKNLGVVPRLMLATVASSRSGNKIQSCPVCLDALSHHPSIQHDHKTVKPRAHCLPVLEVTNFSVSGTEISALP
jgi:hypothetical protein